MHSAVESDDTRDNSTAFPVELVILLGSVCASSGSANHCSDAAEAPALDDSEDSKPLHPALDDRASGVSFTAAGASAVTERRVEGGKPCVEVADADEKLAPPVMTCVVTANDVADTSAAAATLLRARHLAPFTGGEPYRPSKHIAVHVYAAAIRLRNAIQVLWKAPHAGDAPSAAACFAATAAVLIAKSPRAAFCNGGIRFRQAAGGRVPCVMSRMPCQ